MVIHIEFPQRPVHPLPATALFALIAITSANTSEAIITNRLINIKHDMLPPGARRLPRTHAISGMLSSQNNKLKIVPIKYRMKSAKNRLFTM